MPIEKNYDHATTETPLYARWEASGAFACDPKSGKQPYTIMMPPPNVTGSLHMGHALTFTLQDILIRYQRMKGRDVLWLPGTDHAGIATQMVVERQLAAQNLDRRTMGREAFLEKVWAWKEESGSTITRQLRRLGASCDWARERFTMDEGLSRAVTKAFVRLHEQGVIYKAKRLVNWDPKLQTAVSDLEVEQKEVKGHLWHFKYPIENSADHIVVATTRPETMLGDTAVAVHPDNEKLKHLIGKNVVLPLVGRVIPIIGDTYADPEKGTGAVKITPAHDFNDFEVWKRHKDNPVISTLPDAGLMNIFDCHARIAFQGNDAFLVQGRDPLTLEERTWLRTLKEKDRFDARKLVVERMEKLGLLEKVEPHTHAVPHGDRSGVPLEPWLSDQWYCDAPKLGVEALNAVEDGRATFVPDQWINTYRSWMTNLQPWCISRQLWWGHQIPAWYGRKIYEDGSSANNEQIFVAESEGEAIAQAEKFYGCDIRVIDRPIRDLDPVYQEMIDDELPGKPRWEPIYRDPDVFDTWFSSALWPFSTLGWPDETPEMQRYYPTDVLVTGFDIIFFWVARMMMMGLHFTGKAPFKTVYIHALVRDEKGQKMSKSKGNVIDPLTLIDQYSCDALRFTLAHMSTPGRDIKLAVSRIEGNRNFVTKLWNAARFCQMNGCAWVEGFDPTTVTQTVNRWIVGETKQAVETVATHLDSHRFDLAASAAYAFVWSAFCDWYLELAKPVLQGDDSPAKDETRATTAWALGQILHLLHPIMPFVTESLWQAFTNNDSLLMTSAWPEIPALPDHAAQEEINWLIRAITSVRTVRAELNVPAGVQIPLHVKGASAHTKQRIEQHGALITRLARLSGITLTETVAKGAAQTVLEEAVLILPLADIINLDQERARLRKESEKIASEIKKIEAKLGNRDFMDRAPPEIVEEQRDRKAEAENLFAKLQAAEKSLAG